METCAYCRKVLVIKAIMAMVNLKSRDIENELHLSKSIVSRHMSVFKQIDYLRKIS